jgi:hypothetical protein
MLIECTIERDGYTVVSVQRSKYEFKRNEHGEQVCDVISGSHSDYLLKLDDFRKYVPPKPAVKFICGSCGQEFKNAAGLAGHKNHSKDCRNEQSTSP